MNTQSFFGGPGIGKSVMIPHTHTLVATFKARNGKRSEKNFPITTEQATEPMARAAAITNATNYGFGQNLTLVNWTIKEGVEA